MKLEYLIHVNSEDPFCKTKKAFIDFLKVDSQISISGGQITYRRGSQGKPIVSARFRVETGTVQSKDERFFLLALELTDENLVDEFAELGNRVKEITGRINPNTTVVNTLWDDIGRYYATLAYPLINEIENLMRKLISKFMLVNVGMNWSKESIHNDLFSKIENFKDEALYLNDLFKLDFIQLSEVLFKKKRDISLEDIDRLLLKTEFSKDDQEKIKKYMPKSNWEKYFSSVVGVDAPDLEKKWTILYDFRNKVAHNRFLTKSEFDQVSGLSKQVKQIMVEALNKLGELDLNQDDREFIKDAYKESSASFYDSRLEKAVADYYKNLGYVVAPHYSPRLRLDLTAEKDGELIGIEVKASHSNNSAHFLHVLQQFAERSHKYQKELTFEKVELVLILIDGEYPFWSVLEFQKLKSLLNTFDFQISIVAGKINEYGKFEPFSLPLIS